MEHLWRLELTRESLLVYLAITQSHVKDYQFNADVKNSQRVNNNYRFELFGIVNRRIYFVFFFVSYLFLSPRGFGRVTKDDLL